MEMKRGKLWLPLVLIGIALLAAGCGGGSDSSSEEASGPATIYEVEGSDVSRIELTEQALQRLDIQTAAVERKGAGTVIPYSAVLYSPTGETWAYVSSEPLSFIREAIVVDRIEGDRAFLTKGPKPGTKVATVGVAELYGAESGLGQ
jgi:hypothetical protein